MAADCPAERKGDMLLSPAGLDSREERVAPPSPGREVGSW